MERPNYLNKYLLDWNLLDVVLGGKSMIDSNFFSGVVIDEQQINSVLSGYGINAEEPISKAELFGHFQEAMQFIRRYFLKEGSVDGLDLKIPPIFYTITDIGQLLLVASESHLVKEERLWAEIILKIMHTILHADKDLRYNYFSVIQTQIFDRFYKYLFRDDYNRLYLAGQDLERKIPLINFETKTKKSRDSVIMKYLYKHEDVSEELFDRIGVRFITENRFDTLRVIRFLLENHIIIPHNIKSTRSVNSLVDLRPFKEGYASLLKKAVKENLEESLFLVEMDKIINSCRLDDVLLERNKARLKGYQSIQFTCTHLIKYVNPFLHEFSNVRKMAKDNPDNLLAKKILAMDTSLIARDIRFFYPYEIQIVDEVAHKENTLGVASHQEYKRGQANMAMKRVFKHLIEFNSKKN